MSNEKNLKDDKEFRILKAMKSVLTGIIRDTTVPAGHKHPLSDPTIEDIRQCLKLISAREQELFKEAGGSLDMVPHYVDEPQTSTVIPISKIGKRKRNEEDE